MTLDIKNMTSEQLVAWKATQDLTDADPGMVDQLDAIILQKTVDEKVTIAIRGVENKALGRASDKKTLQDWPEMNDKKSDMYLKVTELMENNPNALEAPDALYNTANKVS